MVELGGVCEGCLSRAEGQREWRLVRSKAEGCCSGLGTTMRFFIGHLLFWSDLQNVC